VRGTEQLAAEQKPSGLRKRKMRGRAQPYRKRRGRAPGLTLDAMLKGAPGYLPNPAEFQRQIKRNAQPKRR
jgi:hypothetical protein